MDEYRYAGFWWRVLAYAIDTVILTVPTILLQLAKTNTFLNLAEEVVLQWLYYALLESSVWKATLGKRACGLVVVDTDGDRISFARATNRELAKYISGLTLGIGFLMAGWTEHKQALHDKMAGTLVLRRVAEADRVPLPGDRAIPAPPVAGG